jgi:hypothetical protein
MKGKRMANEFLQKYLQDTPDERLATFDEWRKEIPREKM